MIIESDKKLEIPVQSWLQGAGILLLSDWDVLMFMYRHGPSLTDAPQIASLIGYGAPVVNDALDRLEHENLIVGSRPSHGVRLYRISTLEDAGRQDCLGQLVRLSESREGRLLLRRYLEPATPAIRTERTNQKCGAKERNHA